jgi:hypothetical protein
MSHNLNELVIPTDGANRALTDHFVSTDQVDVYFKDLPVAPIKHIDSADYVYEMSPSDQLSHRSLGG